MQATGSARSWRRRGLGAAVLPVASVLGISALVLAAAVPAHVVTVANEKAKADPKTPPLKALLLTVSDLPAGWIVHKPGPNDSYISGCPAFNASNAKGVTGAQFSQSRGFPLLGETIRWSTRAKELFELADSRLGKCYHLALRMSGSTVPGVISPMSFPTVGDQSTAYQMVFVFHGLLADFDIVGARKADYLVVVLLATVGPPDTTELQQFVAEALGKIPGS